MAISPEEFKRVCSLLNNIGKAKNDLDTVFSADYPVTELEAAKIISNCFSLYEISLEESELHAFIDEYKDFKCII